ncbi:MAG: hypothetical protein ABIK73_06595 [candidate division WOR-3 bacterium]
MIRVFNIGILIIGEIAEELPGWYVVRAPFALDFVRKENSIDGVFVPYVLPTLIKEATIRLNKAQVLWEAEPSEELKNEYVIAKAKVMSDIQVFGPDMLKKLQTRA